MHTENQHEQPPSTGESAPSTKKPTRWHHVLGTKFELLLVDVLVQVMTEAEVMGTPPKADVLLLRREHATWTEEQHVRLPDGIRDTDATDILIEFKYTESLNEKAIRQAIAYDHFYLENKVKGENEAVLATFLMSAKSPSPKRLAVFGFEPSDKPGIYRSTDPIKRRVTILLLNDLTREPHNAFVKCFASKRKEREAAFAMLEDMGIEDFSDALASFLSGLRHMFAEKGGAEMSQTDVLQVTPEDIISYGKRLNENYLRTLSVDKLLKYVPAERILSHLNPEDIWQIPTFRHTLIENTRRGEQRGQQRTLLRSLRRKFGTVPDDTVTLIEQTLDSEQLDEWMDQLFDVETLDAMNWDTTT